MNEVKPPPDWFSLLSASYLIIELFFRRFVGYWVEPLIPANQILNESLFNRWQTTILPEVTSMTGFPSVVSCLLFHRSKKYAIVRPKFWRRYSTSCLAQSRDFEMRLILFWVCSGFGKSGWYAVIFSTACYPFSLDVKPICVFQSPQNVFHGKNRSVCFMGLHGF